MSIACSDSDPSQEGSDTSSGPGEAPGTGGSTSSGFGGGSGEWDSDFQDGKLDVNSAENNCTVTAQALKDSGLAQVTHGTQTLYVGWDQVSGNNQDPVVAFVDEDEVKWCKHHENDGPDARALGLAWDGGPEAYVVYSVVGGGSDLENHGGWLNSYAPGAISGGGPKVSVLGRVDLSGGEILSSTFIIAVTEAGKVNGMKPEAAPVVLADGSVEFRGSSAHKPIGVDKKSSMACTDYPFDATYRFSADLSTLVCAQSTNCSGNDLACSD